MIRLSSIRSWLAAVPCRTGLRPHQFEHWATYRTGSIRLVVERCAHQPQCRAVRSYPDSHRHGLPGKTRNLPMPDFPPPPPTTMPPVRRVGTAVTDQLAPEATVEGSTRLLDRASVSVTGGGAWCWCDTVHAPFACPLSTGARALDARWTYTATPSPGLPPSPKVW